MFAGIERQVISTALVTTKNNNIYIEIYYIYSSLCVYLLSLSFSLRFSCSVPDPLGHLWVPGVLWFPGFCFCGFMFGSVVLDLQFLL
jgi:hypothetical protein